MPRNSDPVFFFRYPCNFPVYWTWPATRTPEKTGEVMLALPCVLESLTTNIPFATCSRMFTLFFWHTLAWDLPYTDTDSLKVTCRSLPHWVIGRKCCHLNSQPPLLPGLSRGPLDPEGSPPEEAVLREAFPASIQLQNPCCQSPHHAPFNYPHSSLSRGNLSKPEMPKNSGSQHWSRPLTNTIHTTVPSHYNAFFLLQQILLTPIICPSNKQQPLPTAMIPPCFHQITISHSLLMYSRYVYLIVVAFLSPSLPRDPRCLL